MKPFAYMRDDGADGYEFCREGDDGAKAKLSFGKDWPTSEDCLRLAEMLREVPGGIGEAIDAFRAIAAQKELSVKY